MTSASTPAPVVSDAQDMPLREQLFAAIWDAGLVTRLEHARDIADAILAPDGPIAAMQAEHQRKLDKLRLSVRCGEDLLSAATAQIAELEAQLAEARALLDPTVSNTKEDGHGR